MGTVDNRPTFSITNHELCHADWIGGGKKGPIMSNPDLFGLVPPLSGQMSFCLKFFLKRAWQSEDHPILNLSLQPGFEIQIVFLKN